MSYLFCVYEKLKSLQDISSWNTLNFKDMSNMISYCRKIESLPDISNWDTRNVTNMRHMFANDFELKQFPYISKWNIELGLENYDISKCKINYQSDISFIFYYCNSFHYRAENIKYYSKNYLINLKLD